MFEPSPTRADPVELLELQANTRIPELVPKLGGRGVPLLAAAIVGFLLVALATGFRLVAASVGFRPAAAAPAAGFSLGATAPLVSVGLLVVAIASAFPRSSSQT